MSFLYINIFYGGLWGIVEATLGYLVHLTTISSTIILLPLAFWFMTQVYKATEKVRSIIIISLISSSIKLLNLFTNIRLDKVINPVISILLEGVVFATLVIIVKKIQEKRKTSCIEKFGLITIMNTLWRLAYCGYLLLAPQWIYANSILTSNEKIIDFMIIKNIITSVIITLLYLVENKVHIPVVKKVNPMLAFSMLIACIIITI